MSRDYTLQADLFGLLSSLALYRTVLTSENGLGHLRLTEKQALLVKSHNSLMRMRFLLHYFAYRKEGDIMAPCSASCVCYTPGIKISRSKSQTNRIKFLRDTMTQFETWIGEEFNFYYTP